NTESSGLLIYLCLFVLIIPKFLNAQDFSGQFDNVQVEHYEKIIFQNESYRKSDHLYYAQVIRRGQDSIVSSDGNYKIDSGRVYNSPFLIEFFGERYDSFSIHDSGEMQFYNSEKKTIRGGIILSTLKLPFILKSCGFSKLLLETDVLIYPNGNISIYFDRVAGRVETQRLKTRIYTVIKDSVEENTVVYREINIPHSWIAWKTLVEFEPKTSISTQ
ncbi:unnamed protein product, partial [Schistosoma turkestanicum]